MGNDTPAGMIAQLKELGIDKNDIAAMRVADVEQKLLRRHRDLLTVHEQMVKDREVLTEKIEKLTKEAEKKAIKSNEKVGKEKAAAIEALGFEDMKAEIGASLNEEKGVITVTLTLKQGDSYRDLQMTFDVPAPENVAAMIKDRKNLDKKIKENEKDMLNVKLDLANIAREERLVRAALAAAQLQSTEGGKLILEKLGTIKSLGHSGEL